jgi:hypothetical protein
LGKELGNFKNFLFFSDFGCEYLREWPIRRASLVARISSKKSLDADFAGDAD